MILNRKIIATALIMVLICLSSITLVSAIAADTDGIGISKETNTFPMGYVNDNVIDVNQVLINDKVNGYNRYIDDNVDELQRIRELINVEKIRLKYESPYQFVESPLYVVDGSPLYIVDGSNDYNVADNFVTYNDSDIYLGIATTNSNFKVTSTSSITNTDVDSDNAVSQMVDVETEYYGGKVITKVFDKDHSTSFFKKLDTYKERVNLDVVIQQIGTYSLTEVVNKNIDDSVTIEKKYVITDEDIGDVQIHPTSGIPGDSIAEKQILSVAPKSNLIVTNSSNDVYFMTGNSNEVFLMDEPLLNSQVADGIRYNYWVPKKIDEITSLKRHMEFTSLYEFNNLSTNLVNDAINEAEYSIEFFNTRSYIALSD